MKKKLSMKVKNLLENLLENIKGLSDEEYNQLIFLTEIDSISFLYLSESKVEKWLGLLHRESAL